jgi:elongation factor G
MNSNENLKYLRNIGIIAHIDAGKTTVTERILFYTGKNYKIGEVHDGKTITDYMDQERERGITIQSAAVTCEWYYNEDENSTPYKINIIDTPGHVDFTIEVERSLRVLDSAVIIFDGVAGVEPQSETVWRQADKYSVPRMCFVNKLDREGADFFACLDSIRKRLKVDPVVLSLPIGSNRDFSGIIDLVNMKSIIWSNDVSKDYGATYTIGDIPEDKIDLANEYKKILINRCIDCSDDFAEKWLEDENVGPSIITDALRFGTLNNSVIPVCCGSAFKNKGVQFLLNAIVSYLPSPIDVPDTIGKDKNGLSIARKPNFQEPFSSLVFKIITDKYGQLAYVRVYSGYLNKGSYVLNTRTQKKMRLGRLVQMFADKREDIDAIKAGDIAAVVGLDSRTGDTITDINNPIILESLEIPPSVVELAIEAYSRNEHEKMSVALSKMAHEDPSLRLIIDKETSQTKIAGMGELHLDIIVDRLQREHNIKVEVGKPQVAYKETITKVVTEEGKYIKQSGGRGQYGHVWLKISPEIPGAGFQFESKVVGGHIPKEYIPSVKKGVQEALSKGIRAGYPVIDISVILLDGSYHDVDSNEMAFKIAASMAFKEGTKKALPVILEPYMSAEVITPEEWMGDVIGDLNARRGRITSINDRDHTKFITCSVPLSSMFGFANDLRSKTQGRANYTMEFDSYKQLPKTLEEDLINKENI